MTKIIQPYHHYYDATPKEERDQDFKLNNLHNYENEPNYFDIARYSSKLKKIPSDKKLRKNFEAHQKRMDSRVLSQKYTDIGDKYSNTDDNNMMAYNDLF